MNFDLCWRAEINIQVGLNMHLYDDIGDASSSLRGSTFGWKMLHIWFFFFFVGNKKHKCVGSSPSLHLDGWVVRVDIRGCQEVRREDAAGNQQTHQRGSGTSSYSSYSPTLAFWGYFTDVERNLEINWKVSELCEQLLVNLFQFSFPYDSGWQFELVQ